MNYVSRGSSPFWFIDPCETNESYGLSLQKNMYTHTQKNVMCNFRNSVLPQTHLGLIRTSVLEPLFQKLPIGHIQFNAIRMAKLVKVTKMCDNLLFFFSTQTTLLYCPSSIDLQTLAEWNSSPISHQFDVISPSHIWIFAHVTQGQDPWIISLSSFLKQENLPKHCCTAVSYAWMFAYTRLQLLSPQVDIK